VFFEVNGAACFADTAGQAADPAKKSVLFVHGAGQDHSIWDLQSGYFAAHDRNAIAVDLPGHGQSEGQALPSIEAIADWLMNALDAARIDGAAIVGNSLGSLAAIAAAARHPDRVRAIALIGVSVPMPVNETLLDAAKNNRGEAIDMLAKWSFSKSILADNDPTKGNALLQTARQMLERARPGVLYSDLKACDGYAAGLSDAATVRCPALLILGEQDKLTPARNATQLAQALPCAETVILPGCGHAMLAEQPDSVLDPLIRVV
jgi:pimeloyl-ACP methyl ester carboxylesterase